MRACWVTTLAFIIQLDEMERQRKALVSEFQREKQKMLMLDHRMKDIQRSLGGSALPYRFNDHDDMVSGHDPFYPTLTL